MQNIKLVLFDIGGVLTEYEKVFTTVEQEQNLPRTLIDKTFDKYDTEITTGIITPTDLYTKCITENTVSADPNYDFVTSWVKDFDVIKPIYDLLPMLKQKYKVELFSNIYKGLVPAMISAGTLPNIAYDYQFLSCELGVQKPDPKAYTKVTALTGLLPTEILFVDDKEENLIPAANIGWRTFHFSKLQPYESVAQLTKLLL